MASAISSLPVPLSPVISTGAWVEAMRDTVCRTRSKSGDLPMILSRRNGLFGAASAAVLLSCTWIAVRIDSNSARLFHGLVMKSNAPARIPCTARWIEPHAVIRITGTSGASTLTFASSSSPSSPVVERV